MKLYLEDIEVCPDSLGQPLAVRWRRREYRVEGVREQWQYNGRWWSTPDLAGECRRYYDVTLTTRGGTQLGMEIYEHAGQWKLSRVLD